MATGDATALDKSIFTVLSFMVLLTWSVLLIEFIITSYQAKTLARITRNLREQVVDAISLDHVVVNRNLKLQNF